MHARPLTLAAATRRVVDSLARRHWSSAALLLVAATWIGCSGPSGGSRAAPDDTTPGDTSPNDIAPDEEDTPDDTAPDGGDTSDDSAPDADDASGDVSPPGGADARYVSPAGNDDDPGTQDRPWRTIQKAAATLTAGQTVNIRAGTYAERVVPENSGEAGRPITYAASPGETVTVDGAGITIPEWGGLFDITGHDYIHVRGLRVINAGPNPHNPGIQVDTANHIVVEGNYVHRTNDSGIAVWNSHDVIVDGNEVVEACLGGFNECITIGLTDGAEVRNNVVHDSQKEGICVKDGSSNALVFGNEVYRTEAVGFYVDAQDKHTFNVEVFNNVSHDGVEDGFAIASEVGGLLENVRVYNNVAYGNGWVGIGISDCCIDAHPMSNIAIINNTSYDNGRDPWGGGIAHNNTQAEGVVIRNNICSRNLSFQIAVATDVPVDSYTVDHNLIDGIRGDEGGMLGDEPVEGDPGFADPGAADFHVREGGAGIDRGSAEDAPTTDMDGDPRPAGDAPDLGADEWRNQAVGKAWGPRAAQAPCP
ncbi:MAG: right-handed parallel beta-helix repeat-containing protein [Planctomycetes bacterium]|nr:right-handed parallel beta-helix repeat-containing protein [Planctomycetota bacterium]